MRVNRSAVVAFVAALSGLGLRAADYTEAAKYTFGQSREPVAAIEADIRAASPEQYKDLESRLLEAMKAPGATADGKRFILRGLSVVGSAKCVPAVAECLTDEKLSHCARIALEALPCKESCNALRDALDKAKGKQLAGIASSLGVKRDAAAATAIGKLIADADAAVAESAVYALGEIGTPEAAKLLDEAAAKAPEALKRPIAKARVTCATRLTEAGKGSNAAAIYKTLLDNPPAPSARIAALRGLIASLAPKEAAALIRKMLEGDDEKARNATLAAYSGSADKALHEAVLAQLPEMKPVAQAALLGVLADQPDVVARPAVLKVLQAGTDEAARAAALNCLTTHGTGDDVEMLLKLALKGGTDGDAAKKVLDTMRGAGVNAAMAKLLETADAATRGAIVDVFTRRRVDEALPVLAKMVKGADATAAAEAAKALEKLGTAEETAAMADVLVSTGDAGLRGALEKGIEEICKRVPDRQPCADAVLAAWEKAKAAPARCALLRLMARVRSDKALEVVRKATAEADADVATAALKALQEWPELSAAPHLLELAKTAKDDKTPILALRACIRLAGMKDAPMAGRLDVYRNVLAAAKRPDEKKQAIAGLGDLPATESLELLSKYVDDPALGTDAAMAAIRLAKQCGPLMGQKAVTILEGIKAVPGVSDDLKNKVDDAIRSAKNAGQIDGYIVAWMLSGPYMQDGKDGGALFDTAFPPEKPGAPCEWRPMTLDPKGPKMIEFDKMIGGDNRVVYLKTMLTSEIPQEVLLEAGSDDGIRIWLNDKHIHGTNAARPCQEGQEKVKLKLNQGANTLLLKITQGGGQWATIVRVRAASGKGEAAGVMVGLK